MLALKIALRYLFSRKSHSAINLITLVAACGIGIITAALICCLSVYNGFEELVGQLTSRFDPDLRIEAVHGKNFADSPLIRQQILSLPEVEVVNATLQETVLLNYNGHQTPAIMKGVDSTFAAVTQIDSILLGNDGFLLKDEVANYCIPGAGLASVLGIGRGFVRPLNVYCPRRVGKINLSNPEESFCEQFFYCSNIFMVQQSDYDDQYFLCALPMARELLGDSLLTSAYEIKLRPDTNAKKVGQKLSDLLNATSSASWRILSRHEQQADAYRIMQIEKWITFLLVIFILLIASFNAIGALSMLIIDKESQIRTLQTLGASRQLNRRIFTQLGWLITGSGALVGTLLGVALCLLQQHFGFISLGNGDTSRYVVSAYPVMLQWGDVVLTLIAVSMIGWLSTTYTVSHTQKF